MHRFPLSRHLLLFLCAFMVVTSCRSPQATSPDIKINIIADGATRSITTAAGSTVTQALQSAGLTIGNSDRTEPPAYTVLKDGDSITLTRVKEEFETEEQIIPFEKQVVRNESIPEGETR